MDAKKTLQNPRKKLTNSIKFDPMNCPFIPVILIKICTRSIIFVTFVENWAIPEFIREQTLWRFTEDVYKILCYKIRKKKIPISLKYVLKSFPFSPSIFIKKRYPWSVNLRQFIENWGFPELIPKLIWHLNMILKTHFQGSSKPFAINYFWKMKKLFFRNCPPRYAVQ